MTNHQSKVEKIAKQLQERKSTAPLTLKKDSVSHEVPKPKDQKYTDDQLYIGNLNEIIEIDPVKKICIAEPGVTFIKLIQATLKYNLAPFVVPELKTITIGGAVAGCSIESMSYKYGGFHDSCLEYEVITAQGKILKCNPANEHRLIFEMMHGTFGTLGIISQLTFKLTPAQPYVKVQYEKYKTLADYKTAIQRHYETRDVDFMDGIIHSPTEYVLSAANFTEHVPYTHCYDWLRVYYLSTKKRKEDYLKTPDYFFRYDRGVTNVLPKTFLGRLFFGKFIDSTKILSFVEKFHKIIPSSMIPVTVDLFIPFSKIDDYLNWHNREIKHYPLWCVPYHRPHDYEWINKNFLDKNKDKLFLDIAIYGMKKTKNKNYYKMIENELFKIGGLKTLISGNFFSEQDFWKIWDKPNYDRVKKQTDPKNIFRDLYSKTCKNKF